MVCRDGLSSACVTELISDVTVLKGSLFGIAQELDHGSKALSFLCFWRQGNITQADPDS